MPARVIRVSVLVATSAAILVALATPAWAPIGRPPPVPVIPGHRTVHVREPDGRLDAFTSIPSGSLFASEGGSGSPCMIHRQVPDPVTGQPVLVDQESFNWIFIEGLAVPLPVQEPAALTDWFLPPSFVGPFSSAPPRRFSVFCQTANESDFQRFVDVPASDPFFDPRVQLTSLLNSVRLSRPTLVADATVSSFGGLVARHPSWFAIDPGSWGMRYSNLEIFKGWVLQLVLRPVRLLFDLAYQPPPEGGGVEAFTVSVPCVSAGVSDRPVPDGARFPARPVGLPEWSEPGVGLTLGLGGCVWTPGARGSVSVVATVTYEVTFWISGFAEPQPDYVWPSAPVVYPVGSLSVVNVLNPGGV